MRKFALLSIIILVIMAGCGSIPASVSRPIPSFSAMPALASEWNLVLDKDFKDTSEPWCDDESYPFGHFYCQQGEFNIEEKGEQNIATMTDGDFQNLNFRFK